jgi:putative transcriptional regulator
MENRQIYNRMMILRKEKGISRVELAERIGVNFQTIGYLEREEYNPSLDLAFRIAEVFELPVDVIFSINPFQSISQILKERSMEEEK